MRMQRRHWEEEEGTGGRGARWRTYSVSGGSRDCCADSGADNGGVGGDSGGCGCDSATAGADSTYSTS